MYSRRYRWISAPRPEVETRSVKGEFRLRQASTRGDPSAHTGAVRNGSWLGWHVLIAVAAITFGSTACDQTSTSLQPESADKTGVETRLTSNPAPQRRPAISGSLIVWEDWRTGDSDIYLHDLTTGKTVPIAKGPGDQAHPAISGSLVVWEDWRGGDADVLLYDVTNGTTTPIGQGPGNQAFPSISNRMVVWEDDVGGDFDIVLHDLESQETWVLTGDGEQGQPQISGTRVVWEDDRFGNSEIYVYDLTTKQERRVTDHPAEQIFPDIEGDFVAWVDFRNGEENIYMFNLSTGQETQVTFAQVLSSRQVTPDFHGESQRFPALSGSLLIWQDYVWNNHDVILLDITQGTKRRITDVAQITRLPDAQAFPDISGRLIVWQDVRSGNSDIFLFDLDGAPDGNGGPR